jgi:dienelactone hydrolase
MKDQITIKGHDGAFAAYIARPKTVPAPAVVVLQELFGVNADIRKHCDELAEQGYLAVAPDLYWRQEPGVDLKVTSEADWQHGLRLYSAYDRDVIVAMLMGAALNVAAADPAPTAIKNVVLGHGAFAVGATATNGERPVCPRILPAFSVPAFSGNHY